MPERVRAELCLYMHPSDQRNGHNTGPDMELLSRDSVTTSIRLRLKSQNPVLYMLKQDTVASVDRLFAKSTAPCWVVSLLMCGVQVS